MWKAEKFKTAGKVSVLARTSMAWCSETEANSFCGSWNFHYLQWTCNGC